MQITLIFSIMTHTTTPAAKATTTTKAAKLDAAVIVSTAAALIKKHGTIAGIDAHRAALRDKYGAENFSAIRKEAQSIRARQIDAAATDARDAVFTYRRVLGAMFRELVKDANFKALCKYARQTYKGTDTDAAAKLVRDYYSAVDAATGAPLVRVSYLDAAKALIYTTFEARELTDADALKALKNCLTAMAATARAAARKGADAKDAAPVGRLGNKHTPGAIVAVFKAETGDAGIVTTGAALTGAKATTDARDAKTRTAAAALIGRAVPAGCVTVSEINAATRAAENAAARAALARERAALIADATAAGIVAK